MPATVFKMTEMKQQGITTVEQILSSLTASQASNGTGHLAIGCCVSASVLEEC